MVKVIIKVLMKDLFFPIWSNFGNNWVKNRHIITESLGEISSCISKDGLEDILLQISELFKCQVNK